MALLEIRDLKKSFVSPEGDRRIILDIPSLSVAADGQVALSGGSGSGKTTLLNVIAGVLRPDSGSVVLDGKDLAVMSESRRDRHRAETIGYVFQTFNLLQGYTVLDNVELAMTFGKGVDRPYALSLLQRVGLADRLRFRPSQLSVGQQQRVAIARALANRPKLVLADEPTGNLDHVNAKIALDLMRSLCREAGASLLLVSHDRGILAEFEHVQSLAQLNCAAAVAEGAAV